MEDGYRIPRLEEFIQGFEFEVAIDYKFGHIDFSTDPAIGDFTSYREWKPCKVWWKHDPNEFIAETDGEGNKLTIIGSAINFFKPFDEEAYIEQELVRVKI